MITNIKVKLKFSVRILGMRYRAVRHVQLAALLFFFKYADCQAKVFPMRALTVVFCASRLSFFLSLTFVADAPYWFFNETVPVQYAYVGGSVNISCDAMGEPPPSFTWLHNNKGIVGFNHRIFMADYGATLQLQIRNASQFGDYKCKVGNALGMLERVIKLRPGAKPIGPLRFQIKRLYPDALELDLRTPRMTNVSDEMQIFGYRVAYMSEGEFKFNAGNWSNAKQRDFSFHRGKSREELDRNRKNRFITVIFISLSLRNSLDKSNISLSNL